MQKQNNLEYKNYGLKINSLFGKDRHNNKHIINNAFGKLTITEEGVYYIDCTGDIKIEHNISNGLLHIIAHTQKDNIKVEIYSSGIMNSMRSDISHVIHINNKNIKANINCKYILLEDSHLIYRTDIICNHISSGQADQKAKILTLSEFNRIDAIPSTNIINTNLIANHGLAIHNLDKNHLYFMSLYGNENNSAKDILIEAFLK